MAENKNKQKGNGQGIALRRLLRNFLVELFFYSLLVIGYFLLVLRLLGDPLARLFEDNLTLYALSSLLLIIAQGFLLDIVVSSLLDFIGLDRLE